MQPESNRLISIRTSLDLLGCACDVQGIGVQMMAFLVTEITIVILVMASLPVVSSGEVLGAGF